MQGAGPVTSDLREGGHRGYDCVEVDGGDSLAGEN